MRRIETQEIGEEEQIIVGFLFSGITEAQIEELGYGPSLEKYGSVEQAREELGKRMLRKYFADDPPLLEDGAVEECVQSIVECLYDGDMERAQEENAAQISPSAAGRNPQQEIEASYHTADATDSRLPQDADEDLEEKEAIMREEISAYLKENPYTTKNDIDVDGYDVHLLVCFGNNLDKAKLAAGIPLEEDSEFIVGGSAYSNKDENPVSMKEKDDERDNAPYRIKINFLDALLAEKTSEGVINIGNYKVEVKALYEGDLEALGRDLLKRARELSE